MTERQLLERFVAANDPDAFRLLVERHGPMVLSVCRGILRDLHDVEDAFQNTFVILAKRANSIKQRDCIGPWLHRVAIRVARRSRASASERRVQERMHVYRTSEYPDHLPDQWLAPMIRREVGRLPERYSLPLTLCYFEGKSNQEAAEKLHCPVGTIKGRLSRARRALRERLAHLGLD